MIRNNFNAKILTDSGFVDFDGVVFKGIKPVVKTILEDGFVIETTDDHEIYLSDGTKKPVISLLKNDEVKTTRGIKKIIEVQASNKQVKVYDIVNAGENRRFYANGILVSNCEFVSSDATLIDSMTMVNISGKAPLFWIDDVKWFEMPQANHIYGIGWDPSTGTGGDNAAIQIYDFTDMVQVGEWKDPMKPCDKQVEVLLKILYFIYQTLYTNPDQDREPDIYWTFENNGVGEAAVMAVKYTGEENFPGVLVSERVGRGNRGFNTSNKKKIASCLLFKRLVETSKITLNSKALLSELKNFVESGSGYKAKSGEHDDLVMATILVVRILQRILNWDDSLENKIDTDINIEDLEIKPILNNE